MGHYSHNPDIEREVRMLVDLGWVFLRGGKHGKLRTPCGQKNVIVPCTPGDHRSYKNFRGDIRRVQRQLQE